MATPTDQLATLGSPSTMSALLADRFNPSFSLTDEFLPNQALTPNESIDSQATTRFNPRSFTPSTEKKNAPSSERSTVTTQPLLIPAHAETLLEQEEGARHGEKSRCLHCHQSLPAPETEVPREKRPGFQHDQAPQLVDFDGPNDPEKPLNMSLSRKWTFTAMTSLLTFSISFASSVFSPVIIPTSTEFQVGEVVMLLGVSLYVAGFALGPLIWGPMSEAYGRKVALFIGIFGLVIFQIPVAVAQNLQTILLCRFLGGVCGASPLAINAAMFADYWGPIDRGLATSIYSAAVFSGPTIGLLWGV